MSSDVATQVKKATVTASPGSLTGARGGDSIPSMTPNRDNRWKPRRDELAHATLRRLAEEGCPITGQRRALVGLIMSRPDRFTADDLLRELRESGARVGRATVFRTLDLLERIGHVGRVPDGGHLAYTACGPGHHHHLVCSGCGQVLHLEGCPVSGLLDELQSRTGYQIEYHRLEVAGICPSCQR